MSQLPIGLSSETLLARLLPPASCSYLLIVTGDGGDGAAPRDNHPYTPLPPPGNAHV